MINGKRIIALSGVESTGKTTLATMLAGRLRSRGVLAEIVYEPGASLPFHPSFLDKGIDGWVYQITHRISREIAAACRSNVETLIVDRTPLDFAAYYATRFPNDTSALAESMTQLARDWTEQYDQVYFLSTEGAEYRQDGFRAPAEINTWREASEPEMLRMVQAAVPASSIMQLVKGTYRERAERVYQSVLASMDDPRALRAYTDLRTWLVGRGWKIAEVIPHGSHSITAFHMPKPDDDIDAVVVVEGDWIYAGRVRNDFKAHREDLRHLIKEELDVLFAPLGQVANDIR